MRDTDSYSPLVREYAGLAGDYDRRWRFYIDVSIEETLKRLEVPKDARVLDVGCGTGELLVALKTLVPDVHAFGIDLSDEMLAMARAKLSDGVELALGAAEQLPFGNAHFDAVVSSNVFHYIRQPKAALREMQRVLKPGGQLIITDWCDDYWMCRLCDRFLRQFNASHFRTYRSEACSFLLTDAGFDDVDVTRYKINWLWGLMTARARRPSG
ncbi:MAG: methyltransferase domain-containing protein [Pseudomonadales bacterium]